MIGEHWSPTNDLIVRATLNKIYPQPLDGGRPPERRGAPPIKAVVSAWYYGRLLTSARAASNARLSSGARHLLRFGAFRVQRLSEPREDAVDFPSPPGADCHMARPVTLLGLTPASPFPSPVPSRALGFRISALAANDNRTRSDNTLHSGECGPKYCAAL